MKLRVTEEQPLQQQRLDKANFTLGQEGMCRKSPHTKTESSSGFIQTQVMAKSLPPLAGGGVQPQGLTQLASLERLGAQAMKEEQERGPCSRPSNSSSEAVGFVYTKVVLGEEDQKFA